MLVATRWQVLGTADTSDTDRDAMRVEAAAVRGELGRKGGDGGVGKDVGGVGCQGVLTMGGSFTGTLL